jgi:signal transduction histidine kinase
MRQKLFHYRLPTIICLSLLGFAANWLKLELFLNVDFIFGSIFVLLAAASFGLVPGVISSLIAGSCTLLLWHHPWALAILTAEAAIVGLIMRRRNISLLAADSLFWLFCGAPLVWLFYHNILAIPDQSCLLIALKQSLNGICNAVVAQLILLGFQSRYSAAGGLPRFRQIIFTVIVSMVLLMGMISMINDLRNITKRQLHELIDDTDHTAGNAASTIYSTLQLQLQSVKSLAQLVANVPDQSGPEIQRLVTAVNKVLPAFHWMSVLDQSGTTIAFDPPFDDNGHSNVGIDYSDRPYIPILRQTLKPYIADILPGKLGDRGPRAVLLAPIIVDGRYKGFCSGVEDLGLIRNLLTTLATHHDMNITLVDRHNNVVATTRRNPEAMRSIESGSGEQRRVNENVVQWIPARPRGGSVMQRWQHSTFIAERQLGEDLPWKVVVEASASEVLKTLTEEAISDIWQLLALFFASTLIATMLNRVFLKPLEDLQKITEELPELIPATIPEQRWPASKMFELDALCGNFRNMGVLLADKFIQQENTHRQLALETEKRQRLELQMLHIREQVEQDERGRISRELHDSLGQILQAVKLNLQIVKARCGKHCGCDGLLIDDVIFEIGAASEELRDIVTMLRPPVLADQNLPEALGWMAERLAKRSGINIQIFSANMPAELAGELKSGLFRICQEALANAIRHGNPSAVTIDISCTGKSLSLKINDDGSGFDPYSCNSGSGIGIMKERAALLGGTFQLKSYPGNGTGIAVEVNLP